MKKITLALATVVYMFSATSFAMTEDEVKNSYNTCMNFLTLSSQDQEKAAAKSGYSLDEVKWACEYQKEMGLERMEQCEVRYQTGHYGC